LTDAGVDATAARWIARLRGKPRQRAVRSSPRRVTGFRPPAIDGTTIAVTLGTVTESVVQEAWIAVEGSPPLRLASLRLNERVCAASTGSARLAVTERWPDQRRLPIVAEVRVGGGHAQRRFRVVVRGCERSHGVDALDLADSTLPLALRVRPRRFRDANVREIVEDTLRAVQLEARWHLVDPTPPLPYVVQGGESDLAFVSRLLAAHGAHFFVDDEGIVSVSDRSIDAPEVSAEPFALLESEDALVREPGVYELWRGARVAPGRVTVADHDWKHPRTTLSSSAAAGRDFDLEQYVWPAGFREPTLGESVARKRLEAARALAEYAEGRSTVARFGPGRRFAVANEDDDREEWFVIAVEHRFDADAGYDNSFVAIPRSIPYRPPVERAPELGGLESAVARGADGADIHTDAYGRFKAEMPWDEDATQTDEGARWARLLQEPSTSMFLARCGWEMLVAYVDGDAARPVGIGRAMHACMAPSYDLPGFQGAATVRTRSSPQNGGGSELCMLDDRGAERMELVAQRDLSTLVKHDQDVSVGRDAAETVGADRSLAVRGDRQLEVGGDRTAHVHGDLEEAIGGSLDRRVGAGESIAVKESRRETVGGADRERIAGVRVTLDGGVGSPVDALKKLVPSPRAALAGALRAAAGTVTAGATGVAQAVTAPLTAAGGLAGAAKPPSVDDALGGANPLAALSGQLDQLKSAVGGLTQLPSMIGGLPAALPGVGDMIGAARDNLAATLKGAVPSLSTLAGALARGEIDKKAERRLSRRVGGAFVSVTLGDISEKALFGHAEMVGGVRLKLTPKTVATSVGGPFTVVVGGTLLRASRRISMQSVESSFVAGAALIVRSDGPLTLRGDQILLRSKASLRMATGDTAIALTPQSLDIEGPVLTDAPTVEITGPAVDVTRG
jgi:type VI secretion system secreted protein VgrG